MKDTDLRNQFNRETGNRCINDQGDPDIDYVIWLEKKYIRSHEAVLDSQSKIKNNKAPYPMLRNN